MDVHSRTSLNIAISWLLILLMVLVLIREIILGQDLYAIAAVLAILIGLSPYLLKKKFGIGVPWFLEALVLVALLLHIAGNTFYLYRDWMYYDIITHILGTLVIALLFFLYLCILILHGKLQARAWLVALFVFTLALSVGALWEVGEFTLDHTAKTNSQHTWIDPDYGLMDTNMDLLINAISSAAVSIFAYVYLRRSSPEDFARRYVKP